MKRVLVSTVAAATISQAVCSMELPVRRVALFTSGVGFFERQGEITGDQTIELFFKPTEMLDLIKSLVIVDEGGGAVSAVTYEGREPLERTLQAFSINLADNPDRATLLNRLRGVTVRLKTSSGEWEGRVVGVEAETIKEEKTVFTRHHLKLYSQGEIRTVRLEDILSFAVLDPKLDADLTAALAALSSNLNRDRRGVRVEFRGTGKRAVRLGYTLEAPVWKTSYRLALGDGDALLQGWAHVENATDEDWRDVQLTLVSGRPISFIQNLYDPIYLKRPEVKPELVAEAPPPVYEAPMMALEAAPRRKAAPRAMAAAPDMAFLGRAEELEMPVAATGAEAGELFVYSITHPVTLPRRQSAMLPIVNVRIGAQKVSIFNRTVNERYAYNGAEFTNTTGQFLMEGPITVFDEGVYAGDARLGHTPRGEVKLLSYAVDLTSEVRVDQGGSVEEITALKVVQGVLHVTRSQEERTEYTVKNKRDRERLFLIEHPVRGGWDLVEPARDVETTREFYRHRVLIPPDGVVRVPFVLRRVVSQGFGLIDMDLPRIEFYLSQRRISPAMKKALEALAAKRRELADLRAQLSERERRAQEISEEQKRIGENLKVLARPSESYSMLEGKLIKNEKDLEAVREEIESLRAKIREKEKALGDYVAQLNLD